MTRYRGTLLQQEPLAKYTSWRIGGPAKQYYRPVDNQDLISFLQSLPADEPLLWLGLGSNLLVNDSGFNGTVIHTQKMAAEIKLLDPVTVYVDAGVQCAKIAKFVGKNSLVGAEWFAGIPGTMGGALAMNAGAFGGETWEHVVAVGVVDRFGKITERSPDEYQISYRSTLGPNSDEWFLYAHLRFTPVAEADQQHVSTVKQLLNKRNTTQPIGLPSCGSVFRNPPGKYAAELIEASKLKGVRIGDAQVSSKHANFIINVGEAKATDVQKLIAKIQQQVMVDHGVKLQPEVKFVGF